MDCEICGKEISGKPLIVRIGGAILYACTECAGTRKVVVPIPLTKREVPPKKSKLVRKPFLSLGSIRTRKQPSELSLKPVDDYGVRVREKREEAGMSIKNLAMIVGIKESLLRKIEAGRITPSISDLRKLERALKVKLIEEIEEEESFPV